MKFWRNALTTYCLGVGLFISFGIVSVYSSNNVPVEYGPGIYQKIPPSIDSPQIAPPVSMPASPKEAAPILPIKSPTMVIRKATPQDTIPQTQPESFEEVLETYTKGEEMPLQSISQPIPPIRPLVVTTKESETKDLPKNQHSLIKEKGQQRVGLLLPLSGRHASLGRAFLRVAQIALFEAGNPNLQILPLDTQGTPEGAKMALEKGMHQGAVLFLGPIFAPEVAAIQERARIQNAKVIGFSNDQRLAKKGTYILAFFPKAHIGRILDFALEHDDHKIVLLAPNNKYGEIVEGIFKDKMKKLGEKIHVLKYAPDQLEKIAFMVKTIQRIRPHFLLIPQGSPTLDHLLEQLALHGLDLAKYTILGGDQWCTSGGPKNTHVKQAFFAGPNPKMQKEFNKKYETIYGEKPPLLASLIYDGVLLSAILGAMYPSNPFSHEYLTTDEGFEGLTGVFRFSPHGKAQRRLEIIQVGEDLRP